MYKENIACPYKHINYNLYPTNNLTLWQALLHTCLYSLAFDSEWYPAPKGRQRKTRIIYNVIKMGNLCVLYLFFQCVNCTYYVVPSYLHALKQNHQVLPFESCLIPVFWVAALQQNTLDFP